MCSIASSYFQRAVTYLSLGAVLLLSATVVAQQPLVPVDSNSITGFEALNTWSVTGNSAPPGFAAATTSVRTEASAAYAISNPPNLVKVISQPISSTAKALDGMANSDARLQVDLFIPVQQGNKVNSGYIQPYVSSRSRGLSKVALPQVSFAAYRPGIYNTLNFAVPQNVRTALAGSTYSDLIFEFDINSPGKITGSYLLDNLRVHSNGLLQSPNGDPPPPGYGGSVDLVVHGDSPVAQSYDLGPTQIPGGFHLKMGTVKTTTVELKLGLDTVPKITCSYNLDGSDSSGHSYKFKVCSDGFQPGDLVNANWLSLGIVGGDSTQKIRAQIALSPMGDVTGAALIPPMPTFWGDADTCVPNPVDGTVVTLSLSCAKQIADANTIITNYFKKVQDSNPPSDWIVPPVPEYALRTGDGAPSDYLLGPPTVPNDPPFDTGSHLNPGGSFDAYWRLNGNLTPTIVPNTDENKTHFEATFGAHGVLFGHDVDVMSAKVTADTDSGQTTPTFKNSTSTGNFGLYVFGVEIPPGGKSVNPSVGYTVDASFADTLDLPSIQIWIFSITLGADVSAGLKGAGSAAVSGLDLSLTPSAALGMHASGGIDAVIASGKVDAHVNLATVSTPIVGQVKWVLDTSPQVCSTTLDGKLKGDLNLSSGGGKVDLVATFGICPFCDTETYHLFKWDPLVSKSYNLFDATIDTTLFGLPSSLCTFPVTVGIVSPLNGASLNSTVPITLSGSAVPTDSTIQPTNTTYSWTYTPGANASTVTVNQSGDTAHPVVTFGAPTSGTSSTWTIGLSSTVTTKSAGGTSITSSGTATPVTVTVISASSGVYIAQVSSNNGVSFPDANGVIQIGGFPGSVSVLGSVLGNPSGTLNTTFTIAQCTDGMDGLYTSVCASTGAAVALPTANAATTSPTASAAWNFGNGTFKITMTTTKDGVNYGTYSVIVYTLSIL